MRIIVLTLISFLLIIAVPVTAQDFNKGLAAAQAGDFATAWKEWMPLAEDGDSAAQYNLGIIYNKGWGVPQDYKEAVKCYTLAAEQGVAVARYRWLGRRTTVRAKTI
jgi:hypothetical protein